MHRACGALRGAWPYAVGVPASSRRLAWRLGRRTAATFEAAPAVGALGLPEAFVSGATDRGSSSSSRPPASCKVAVVEVSQELAKCIKEAVEAGEAAGYPPQLTGVQYVIDQAVALAQDATMEELAYLATTFEHCRLRLALRDLLPSLQVRLREGAGPEAVAPAMRMLSSFGRGSLFVSELFEFLADRVAHMQAAEVSSFVYEVGRHGLRCRHFGERALPKAVELLPQMSLEEVMRCWQGFLRFSRDRRGFYVAARPRVQGGVKEFSTHMLLLAMRVARDLSHQDGFIDLHAACGGELVERIDKLTPSEAANALCHAFFNPKFRVQAQTLVRRVAVHWEKTQDLSSLRTVEVVDALETFASWGIAVPGLLTRLDEMLVAARVELQYAGNVGLWVKAVKHLAKLELAGARWPLVALELARDPHFLNKSSAFEQCSVAESFARLRIFDEVVFSSIAATVLEDMSIFRGDVHEMATFVQACGDVGFFHEGLLDRCYDHLLGLMDEETLDLSKRTTHRGIIQLAWCFAVAGLHRRHESFPAVLDYVFFQDLDQRAGPQLVECLQQLADIVSLESPELVKNCQFAEKVQAARASSRARNLVSSRAVGDQALLQEVGGFLQKLGWSYDLAHLPDEVSSVSVDLSLERHAGRKVGLLFAGARDLVSCGLPDEQRPRRECGRLVLARRLLGGRGWTVAVLERSRWAALATDADRRVFLEELLTLRAPNPMNL